MATPLLPPFRSLSKDDSSSSSSQDSCCFNPFGTLSSSSSARNVSFGAEDPTHYLAEAMKSLSVEEREVVYEEMHGVDSEEIKETPELITRSIASLKDCLSKEIPKPNRRALEKALFLKPTLLEDEKFILIFLRCQLFDIAKAANAICIYFEHKLQLFDESLLVKRITMKDLTAEDKISIQKGSQIVLPQKDRSGRTIRIGTIQHYNFLNWKSELRSMWYQNMTLLEDDEDFQRKGTVDIINCYGGNFPPFPVLANFMSSAKHIWENWPFRTKAFHYCYNNAILNSVFSIMYATMTKDMQLRTKLHCGAPLEVSYTLRTFGVDLKDFLILSDRSLVSAELLSDYGNLLEDLDKVGLEMEGAVDNTHNDTSLLRYPAPGDILVGRGRSYQEHPGNKLFTDYWIPTYSARYHQVEDKFSKSALVVEILQRIKDEQKGKFIQRTEHGWKVVEVSASLKKISQALRLEVRKTIEAPKAAAATGPRLHTDPFAPALQVLSPNSKRRRLNLTMR